MPPCIRRGAPERRGRPMERQRGGGRKEPFPLPGWGGGVNAGSSGAPKWRRGGPGGCKAPGLRWAQPSALSRVGVWRCLAAAVGPQLISHRREI